MNNQILFAIKSLERRVVDLYSKLKNGTSSSSDLEGVTTQGNTTTNDIEFIDGAKILFENGSRLQKGTTNSYNGGNGGISQVCSIDYELKWEAGRQYVMQQDGFTIREVRHNFTLTPGVNDDFTKGFVLDSRWILDNGDIYLCTDDTEGVAVWVLQVPADSRPYKVFTALLTQSGENNSLGNCSDDPQPLIIGVTYTIVDADGTADFTNVGAPNNEIDTFFVATGTIPNSWGTSGDNCLYYNTGAPVVTVLENTIGNIWFIYMATGYYTIKNSNGQFKSNIFYTTQISSVDPILYSLNTFSVSGWDDFTLNIIGSGDGLLFKAPIEIRVYS